jgi:hypothetical protein
MLLLLRVGQLLLLQDRYCDVAVYLLLRVRQLLLLQDRYCDVAVMRITYVASVVAAGKTVVAAPGQTHVMLLLCI